jgi:hypothetical protein
VKKLLFCALQLPDNKNNKAVPQKNLEKNALEIKYCLLLPLIINQQKTFKMKKSLIAAALLVAFGTVTFAQDATGTKTTTDKKTTTTTKTEKKTTMKKGSSKKAEGDKKAAADKK